MSFATVEGDNIGDIGFIEVESIVRDNSGVILYADPLLTYQHIPLESVEIIGIIESGPQGPPGPQGPQGPPGVSGDSVEVRNEIPLGVVDGVNKVFTTQYNFSPRSTIITMTRLRYMIGEDYTETGSNEITFTTPPRSGNLILIDYKISDITT